MATRFQSSVSNTINSSSLTSNRSESELQIALNAKYAWGSTALTQMVNAATIKCTYYSINVNESTYRDGIEASKDVVKSRFYTKINNFVMYQRDGADIEESSEDDQREVNINLTSHQSLIIGVTGFIPKVGDHVVLASQKELAIPYMINKVTPTSYIDRECFRIDYSPSPYYRAKEMSGETSYNVANLVKELEGQVVATAEYVASATGTGQATIQPTEVVNAANELGQIYTNLARQYSQAFYNEKYDIIGMNPSWLCDGTVWFRYVSMVEFQLNEEILKYGFDNNTLFVESVPDIENTQSNYLKSIYQRLMNKDFEEYSTEVDMSQIDKLDGFSSIHFTKLYEPRDIINADHEYMYVPKYAYVQKFYFREYCEHSMLTAFYKSNFTMVDIIDGVAWNNKIGKSEYVYYYLRSPIITKFLDAYMDDGVADILGESRYLNKLKKYTIDKDNVDDYMGIPLLLYAIKSVIGDITKSSYTGAYTLTKKES